jgi:hypothetical protein
LILKLFLQNVWFPEEKDHSGNKGREERVKVLPDKTPCVKRKENLLSL